MSFKFWTCRGPEVIYDLARGAISPIQGIDGFQAQPDEPPA